MDSATNMDHNNIDTFTLPLRNGTIHDDKKTQLMDLPVEILRCICEFLLSAREVDRGYNDDNTRAARAEVFYDLQTAIMRTNRALHEIARTVFVANHVIHISSSDTKLFMTMFGSMPTAPIWLAPKLWSKHIEDATDIRMDVYFDTYDFRKPYNFRGKRMVALVLLESLVDLVAMMAAYEILVHSQLGLSLEIRGL